MNRTVTITRQTAVLMWIIFVTSCLTLTTQAYGCAKPRHAAVVVDTALYESINAVHTLEQTALCGQPSCAGVTERVTPQWTDAKSQAFNKALLPAGESGRQLNAVLATWNPSDPPPAQVHELITSLTSALGAITADFPPGTTREAIFQNLARAQAVALGVLDIVLTVKGGQ